MKGKSEQRVQFMHLLIKFQELVKVHFKEERTETENLEKYGGEMRTKTGMKNNSKKNFVYINVNLVIQCVSLDLLFEKIPTNLLRDPMQPEKQ